MNIFATPTVSFKVEEICCYYLCKDTYDIFTERDSSSRTLLISKSHDNNENDNNL